MSLAVNGNNREARRNAARSLVPPQTLYDERKRLHIDAEVWRQRPKAPRAVGGECLTGEGEIVQGSSDSRGGLDTAVREAQVTSRLRRRKVSAAVCEILRPPLRNRRSLHSFLFKWSCRLPLLFEIVLVDDDGVTRERLASSLVMLWAIVFGSLRMGARLGRTLDRRASQDRDQRLGRCPEMDGLEFCQRVRDRLQTEYTYFILITANGPGELGYDYAIGEQVDDYLVKPVERDQLWRRLRVATRILRFTTADAATRAIAAHLHLLSQDSRGRERPVGITRTLCRPAHWEQFLTWGVSRV